MAKDNKFSFFESYHKALSNASDERYGRIVRAMSDFVFKQEEPSFSDDNDVTVWELIKPIIEHGLEISGARAEAGRKGRGISRNKGNRNAVKGDDKNNTKQNKNNTKQNGIGIGIGIGIGKENIKETTKVAKKSEFSLERTQDDRFVKFETFLKRECPRVAKMKKQMTESQFFNLLDRFNGDGSLLAECLRQLDNSKKGVTHVSVYRTMIEWDRKNYFDGVRREKGGASNG